MRPPVVLSDNSSCSGCKSIQRGSKNTARWIYDSPAFRRAFNSGKFHVDMDRAVKNYFDWLSNEYLLTFENKKTGDSFQIVGPKRGNKQFARKKRRKVNEVVKGMRGLQFDFPLHGHRGIVRNCHMMLITLTFSHETSMDSAWFNISSHGGELNRFRANLTKKLGSKATICTKEAQSNGYPAPHILVLLDKPVRARKHFGKKTASWRLEDRSLLNSIKSAWRWGFVDVEAVVMSSRGRYRGYESPVGYLSKYMTKELDLTKNPELMSVRSFDDIPKDLRTAVSTHVWNKILRSRDLYISKAFKERLNNPLYAHPKEEPDENNGPDWALTSIEGKCAAAPGESLPPLSLLRDSNGCYCSGFGPPNPIA